jgi:hypothetical protein
MRVGGGTDGGGATSDGSPPPPIATLEELQRFAYRTESEIRMLKQDIAQLRERDGSEEVRDLEGLIGGLLEHIDEHDHVGECPVMWEARTRVNMEFPRTRVNMEFPPGTVGHTDGLTDDMGG